MNHRDRSTQSIDSRILAAIHGRGRGSVFVPADFLDLGSRQAIDIALHRLAQKGTIRRLARGVYDFPKEHPVLGLLSPSSNTVAHALAGRDRTRLQPAGAYAANILGLSEQVPAKAVFLTDGPSRTVKIGPTTIQLRRTTPRNMEAAGRLRAGAVNSGPAYLNRGRPMAGLPSPVGGASDGSSPRGSRLRSSRRGIRNLAPAM